MSEADQITPPVEAEAAPAQIDEVPTVEKEVLKVEEEKVEETGETQEEKDEEKETQPPSEKKDGEGEGVGASETPTDTDGAPTETPSFKEESYNVADLKEFEKKALEAFRLKVEEAIKTKSLLKKKKAESKKEAAAAAPEEPPKEVGTETEASKTEEVAEASAATPSEVGAEKEVVKVDTTTTEEVKVDESGISKEESTDVDVVVEKAPEEAVDEGVTETTDREIMIEDSVPPGPQNFYLWDIPIHDGDERTDVVLLKFLRARDFKVNDAFNMLKNTVAWRKDFVADSLVDEDLGNEFEALAYMHGYDKEGHPVCYNEYGAFQNKELYQQTFGDEKGFNKFLRWRIQVLEKSVRKLDFTPGGVNSTVQVLDLKSSPGIFKRRQIAKKAVNLVQDNYPELVSKQIILNIPWYFPAIYGVFGRLFTPRMERKVVLARPGKSTETLFKYISPEQVPIKYGGLSRPGDTAFEGLDAKVTEIIVKPGETRAVDLRVEEAGSTVVWDLSVVGWEVIYGEEFIPSYENGYTIIIQKAKKVAAATDPIRNAFKAAEPGKIVLTIVNTASKKKIAVYRSTTKKTIDVTYT